ncbi:hypothetical protein C8R44DRAFT_725808 [Mycena epipterygia]|nr:hypothetical protein C8R44DRAFT_725808 [Mycena epipterygia]
MNTEILYFYTNSTQRIQVRLEERTKAGSSENFGRAERAARAEAAFGSQQISTLRTRHILFSRLGFFTLCTGIWSCLLAARASMAPGIPNPGAENKISLRILRVDFLVDVLDEYRLQTTQKLLHLNEAHAYGAHRSTWCCSSSESCTPVMTLLISRAITSTAWIHRIEISVAESPLHADTYEFIARAVDSAFPSPVTVLWKRIQTASPIGPPLRKVNWIRYVLAPTGSIALAKGNSHSPVGREGSE